MTTNYFPPFQPNMPSYGGGGLTNAPGMQNPYSENMKADSLLARAQMNPTANPAAIGLAQQIGGAADAALSQGMYGGPSPIADLLADLQGSLASIAGQNDGMGLNPMEVTNLLGRVNNAKGANQIPPELMGMVDQASTMLSGWLQQNPMGEYDAWAGDNMTQGSAYMGAGAFPGAPGFPPGVPGAIPGFPGPFPGFPGPGFPGAGGFGQF